MRSAIAAAAILGVAVLAAAVALSGGTSTDPSVPRGFPGVVPAFMEHPAHDVDGAVPGTQSDTRAEIQRDRQWLARSRSLGAGTPQWARWMYRRSLLVLRASVDPRSGAAVAGARTGWAYVWPRDAGAVAIALASAGYRGEAQRVVRFLLGLDLGAAARFDRDGEPVEGRAAQGDATGWVAAAARAGGLRLGRADDRGRLAELSASAGAWRGRADYQEKDGGDYLGNAIASAFAAERIAPRGSTGRLPRGGPESGDGEAGLGLEFESEEGLMRIAGDADSGLDTAAAWAARPFRRPALVSAARRTLLRLVAERESRFGLLPSESWDGGQDPWTAPTAWTAWALAGLAREERRSNPAAARRGRHAALGLMADLRRAATPLGLLPERVDARTGRPASTTPLAWSHAFAILALRELWPGRAVAQGSILALEKRHVRPMLPGRRR